jgi:hypothetical protein
VSALVVHLLALPFCTHLLTSELFLSFFFLNSLFILSFFILSLCLISTILLTHSRSNLPPKCSLPLAVEPSPLPAAFQIFFNGAPLPSKQVAGDDGMISVFILESVRCGEPFKGLSAVLLDEGGKPAKAGVKGRVTASWKSKSATLTWDGETPLPLPRMTVR